MMVTAEGSSPLGHHAAPDALELGGAHGAAERPCPKAVGHAVHLERIGPRCDRMNVLRHVGFTDRATGRAAQVDLPIVSPRHAANIAAGDADIQSQVAPRGTMQPIVRTRPRGPGRPERPSPADITTSSHSFAPFVSIAITEPRFLGARAKTACPPSRPQKPKTVLVVRPDCGSAMACEPLSWCCPAPYSPGPGSYRWWWCWRAPCRPASGSHTSCWCW
jgi:hypothetical protein